MNRIISFILLIFSCLGLHAQNGSLKLSPTYKAVSNQTHFEFAGNDGSFLYLLRWHQQRSTQTVFVESFDKDMNRANSQKLRLIYEETAVRILNLSLIGDRLCVIANHKDKKSKKHFLLLQELDKQSLKPIGKLIKLNNSDSKDWFNLKKPKFSQSPDHKALLIYCGTHFKEDGSAKVGMIMLNENLEITWQEMKELRFRNALYSLDEAVLSDSATVYLVGTEYLNGRSHTMKGECNYSRWIIPVGPTQSTNREYVLRDAYYPHITLTPISGDYFYCTAVYSNESSTNAAGYMTARIHSDSVNFFKQQFHHFDAVIRSKLVIDLERSKEFDLPNLEIVATILKRDGSAFLVFEVYTTFRIQLDTKDNVVHRNKELIVVKLDALSNESWSIIIPKFQKTFAETHDYASCFSRFDLNSQKLQIYYNEHPNFAQTKMAMGHEGFDMHTSTACKIAIDGKGEWTKTTFLDNTIENITFHPNFSTIVRRKQYVVLYKGLEYKLGRID